MKQSIFLVSYIFSCLLALCQVQTRSSQSKPLVIGETDEIRSVILSKTRVLNIYLPQDYHTNDTTHFPVVYLLDGGTDEDFLHITGLYQFNSFPWINRVAPSIIVGIVNNDRRQDMTFPTKDTGDQKRYPTAGQSAKFIDFIEKELQPFIETKFKASSSKTLIGESLGGLLATEILLKRPTLFNHYIIVSPSLWWDNGSLLKLSLVKLQDTSVRETNVYIGVGKEGLTPGDTPRVMEVDANVLAEKIKGSKNKNIKVYFDYLPQENHATIMHQAVFNALRFMEPAAMEPK